jgi:Uncharacterized conserved protein (COG2071)
MDDLGTPRQRHRWHHAAAELDDFAIITYRVDQDRLAALLPPGVVPQVLPFDDGGRGALVSAVAFRDRDFHFRFCPPVGMSCGQINYRAYVLVNGEPGVWFFGTDLDHPLVLLPRLLWQMPWQRARISIEAQPGRWHLAANDSASASHCELTVTDRPLGRLDGFADAAATVRILTHPADGWYQRRDGAIGHYSIWHEVLAARVCSPESARFPFFEKLGLITADAAPHSAVSQPTIHFDIHTPPRRRRPSIPAA